MFILKRRIFFYKIQYDLKGHYRSQKVILKFQNPFFAIYYLFNAKSSKNFSRTSQL